MDVILKEYSGIIIVAVVIIALIAIIGFLLATNGPVQNAFNDIITGLFSKTGI